MAICEIGQNIETQSMGTAIVAVICCTGGICYYLHNSNYPEHFVNARILGWTRTHDKPTITNYTCIITKQNEIFIADE